MKKAVVVGVLLACVVAFFALDFDRLLTLEAIKERQTLIEGYYEAHPARTLALFFLFYVAVTTLSIPGAALLTLVAGALFGLAAGTVLVSFASSLGALAAFLLARFLFRDIVQARFERRVRTVDAGIQRDGPFYLFALRLVPAIPFFVVNVVMGLTAMRPWTFYWVSQLGMLAGTLVYVNAGTQLARVESLTGILSPQLIGSFLLLAVFPLAARKALDIWRDRKVRARYPKPARFDRNLIVIGGGSAGLVSAYLAAALKAKVTLIERDRMGGDCLNTGCVPSKALIRTGRLINDVRRAAQLGVAEASMRVDFPKVRERVQRVIATVAPHDSAERFTALGVDCIAGEAHIVSPYRVDIRTPEGTRSLTARAIVIATGAEPLVPPIPGLDAVGYLTSDNVWELSALPERLLVLGGGPIGCELAQCFARLGSHVTQIEMQPRILGREDPEVSQLIRDCFQTEGIRVLTSHRALRFLRSERRNILVCEHAGEEVQIEFDQVLCALGRKPRSQGFGLESLQIGRTSSGAVEVDEYGRTRISNIYACGDASGPYQFTHMASHTAWYATLNALLSPLWKLKIDYGVVPWCTFTEPEVARVGLNESEAVAQGIAYEATLYPIEDLDRAIADEAARGFVKVLTQPGKDRILGATIVAGHAGEMIAEFVAAMKHRIGLNKILGTIHVYPTWTEANKAAAGRWKQAHAPQGLLRLAERVHDWVRG